MPGVRAAACDWQRKWGCLGGTIGDSKAEWNQHNTHHNVKEYPFRIRVPTTAITMTWISKSIIVFGGLLLVHA